MSTLSRFLSQKIAKQLGVPEEEITTDFIRKARQEREAPEREAFEARERELDEKLSAL